MTATNALRLRDLTKSFGTTTVLDRISLDIAPGEVHGLVGENGSGKSTLVKVLGGVHTPDDGSQAHLWDVPLDFPVSRPYERGLAIIHQDLALVESMSVADNIGITSSFDTRFLAPVNRRRELGIVRRMANDFGADIDPSAPVSSLSPADRSVVGILRALRQLGRRGTNQMLVLDEPTAALPEAEAKRLLQIVRSVAESGAGVLFISHHLQEVLGVCDRISVLRSGKLVSTLSARQTSESEIVQHMLGYELDEFYPDKEFSTNEDDALRVSGLSGHTISDVSFSVRKGEILGVSGLAGMGQDELPYLIYGAAKRTAGKVRVFDKEIGNSPRASLSNDLALVPGNRQRDAVWMAGTATENLTLPFLPEFSRGGFLRHKRESELALEKMGQFGTRPLRPSQPMERFSGGNQQKIVMARWLHTQPKVLLLHEPTQGVDAGAKKELLSFIQAAAVAGTAVIICSSDTEEVAAVCHRVIVLEFGQVKCELDQYNLSEDKIMRASQLS